MFDIFIKEHSDLNDETISQTYHRPVFGPGKTQWGYFSVVPRHYTEDFYKSKFKKDRKKERNKERKKDA